MTVAMSTAALALSIAAFLTSRWRDRRDLMLRMHERLISADQQRGRRLIHSTAARRVRAEDLSDEDYELINNALASLNNLGIYYRRRYIRRKDVLEFWALPVVRVLSTAEPFLAHRDELVGTRSWPELHAFAANAQKYLRRNWSGSRGLVMTIAG